MKFNRYFFRKFTKPKKGSKFKLITKSFATFDEVLSGKRLKRSKTHWLFLPKNKHLLEELQESLKQAREGKIVSWNDIKHKYKSGLNIF